MGVYVYWNGKQHIQTVTKESIGDRDRDTHRGRDSQREKKTWKERERGGEREREREQDAI